MPVFGGNMSIEEEKNILEKIILGVQDAIDPTKKDELLKMVHNLKESERKINKVDEVKKEKKAQADGPIGLDVGTSRLVSAIRNDGDGKITHKIELNAFFTVPQTTFTNEMFVKNKMSFTKIKEYAFGKKEQK